MELERINYENHLSSLKWKQGEHIFISGPTGSGKTTLARGLLEKRSHVVGFGVKVHDRTLTEDFKDWQFVQSFRDVESWMNRVMVWPRMKRRESSEAFLQRQRDEFRFAMNSILRTRNWSVFLDELGYMSDPTQVGLANIIATMHMIGRSSGLSILSLAQRPMHIPQHVISNVSHAYIAKTKKSEDMKRLGDLSGDFTTKEFQAMLAGLPTKHDFIYVPALADGDLGVINTRM